MFFGNYRNHPEARINPKLFWEYDADRIDYEKMRSTVVQRVIERGWMEDWYGMLNRYGEEGVKEAIVNLSYLNDKDMNFVSKVFDIPLTTMKCYTKKQSTARHWNS